ncbi:MAG: hypothetical protein K9G62_07265 [Alphaproteobacteria bacterium]|nr:hypothetical protein [Alphaproteobacteria bacterium]
MTINKLVLVAEDSFEPRGLSYVDTRHPDFEDNKQNTPDLFGIASTLKTEVLPHENIGVTFLLRTGRPHPVPREEEKSLKNFFGEEHFESGQCQVVFKSAAEIYSMDNPLVQELEKRTGILRNNICLVSHNPYGIESAEFWEVGTVVEATAKNYPTDENGEQRQKLVDFARSPAL